jgi:hypothetical protein
MNGNVIAGGVEPLGQFESLLAIIGVKIDIENPAALITMKVAMLVHVRAVPHGSPVEVHLFDEVALDQKIEAIIDRRHRNLGHRLLGTHEDLLGGRMVTFAQEDVIDLFPLRRETHAARFKALDGFAA